MKTEETDYTYEINQEIEKIDNATENFSVLIDKVKDLNLVEVATQAAQMYQNISMANAQLNFQMEMFREKSYNNLVKFNELVRGAESRLDRQLDMMEKLTSAVLERDLGSMDEKELQAQETLMRLIEKACDNFNNELERLYSI